MHHYSDRLRYQPRFMTHQPEVNGFHAVMAELLAIQAAIRAQSVP